MSSDILTVDLVTTATTASQATDLRPLRPDDAPDLASAYLASFPAGVGAGSPAEADAEIAATYAGEYGMLRYEASFVAAVDGRAHGAVLVVEHSIWDEDLGGPFVIDLFVAPPLRGRGLGRRLVEAAMHACADAGDITLSLRIGAGTSPAAHALYTRLGFTVGRCAAPG